MAVNEPKKRMRGQHQSSSSPFGYVGLESRGSGEASAAAGRCPACCPEHLRYRKGQANIRHRRPHHPSSRLCRQPAGPQTDRGSVRLGQGQCGAPKDQVPEPGQSAIPVHPRLLLASISSEYPSCSRRPGHDMHFSRGDHTRWRSVASLLESYGAITGGETREEAVTQQSFINRQGDAIGDISVRRNRGAVGFDLWQNHRENAVDMSAPAESCGPFGRGRGTTL
jgi:hypothetical protein